MAGAANQRSIAAGAQGTGCNAVNAYPHRNEDGWAPHPLIVWHAIKPIRIALLKAGDSGVSLLIQGRNAQKKGGSQAALY